VASSAGGLMMRSARAGRPSIGFDLLVSVFEEVINSPTVVDMPSAALAMIGGGLRAAHEGACGSSQLDRPVTPLAAPNSALKS
jgi:hypothetical protein